MASLRPRKLGFLRLRHADFIRVSAISIALVVLSLSFLCKPGIAKLHPILLIANSFARPKGVYEKDLVSTSDSLLVPVSG